MPHLRVSRTPSPPPHPGPQGAAAAEPAGITVLLFGSLRQEAGWERRDLIHAGSTGPAKTPALLWQELGMESLGILSEPDAVRSDNPQPVIRVAVNQEFGSPHTVLQPGDEVAFMPPISGG